MHDRKVYPPRVEMTVQLMSTEQRHTKLSISFDGCSSDRDSPKFQLFLPLGVYKSIQTHASFIVFLIIL